jgi:hypothetical protein
MKTIGILLQENVANSDTQLVWRKTDIGYSLGIESSSDDRILTLSFSDFPDGCKDHDLYSWVMRGDQAQWINTFGLTKSQRLSVTDLLATTGQTLQAHLVTAFASEDPMLILFGRGEAAFAQVQLNAIVDEATYNRDIRPTLFPSLRVSAQVAVDGTAIATAQLLETDGTASTRSGVTLYWEATGGYWVAERTDTVNGKAVAKLKDFGAGVRVKVGFKNYPAKAEVLL